MIVCDLDGTLLRSDKTISDRTKAVLKQCRETGIKFVYATGRGGSAEEKAPAELFDGRITMNGAIARVNDTVVYSRLMPYLVARPLLLACDAYGLKTASELSDFCYSNFDINEEWPGSKGSFTIVDFTLHDVNAEKLYMVTTKPEEATFIERHLPETLYLTVSRDGLAQVMHKDATKAKAVAALAEYWDIRQEEIVAFGDDLNDINLLRYVGVGIAMENALPEVKSAVRYVCKNNDEDGVAGWIEKNLL